MVETCNTKDDDCDGEIDEEVTACSTATMTTAMAPDLTTEACEAPVDHATTADDCDDSLE